MQAARWDTVFEVGSVGRRVVRRRSLDDVTLPLAAPVTWTWRDADGDIVRVLTADVEDDLATFDITATHTAEPARYTHDLVITNPLLNGPEVICRGYVTINRRMPAR